jgi:hypothetical protein
MGFIKLNTRRLGSVQGYGLDDMLLDSISAVVLGGTSVFGGEADQEYDDRAADLRRAQQRPQLVLQRRVEGG